jgi:site-specific DNA recombinase
MRAALYCRVSTAAQTEKYSLGAQQSILADYCKREGHSTEFFEDAGISGETIAARPEFQRLLRKVEAGKFDVVLAVDQDRYSRDLTDWQKIKQTFRKAHVRWGTPSSWLHDNEFIVDINSAVAAEEKRKILARTMRGKIEAARRGKHPGTPPFGYSKDKGMLAVLEPEAKVVRRIFKMAQSGKAIRAITRALNSAGLPTPSMGNGTHVVSATWDHVTVSRLLRSKVYVGQAHWGAVPMTVPPIVSQEDFDAVQPMLESNSAFTKRHQKHEYLVKGLLFCECGARMYGHSNDHGKWRYYFCSKNCGRFKNAVAGTIERQAFTDAYKLLSDHKVVRDLYRKQKAADPERTALADAMSAINEELERLPVERKRVMDAYQHGAGDVDDLKKRLARIDARQVRLEKDLSTLQAQGETSVSQAERRSAWLAAVEALKKGTGRTARRASMKALLLEWKNNNGNVPVLFEAQQRVVRAVFERIVYRPGKGLSYTATVPLSHKGTPVCGGVPGRYVRAAFGG